MKTSWCIDLLWKVFWDSNYLVYCNSLTVAYFNWKIFKIMKVEIGFKHAEMKSEDANDRAYYAGLLFFFFGFNARIWIFIQLKILLSRDNDSKRCKRQRRYMRREHMNRNPIEMSVIPVSNDIMVCFKCYPVRIISYPIQWLSDINSTSSNAKVKEFFKVRRFYWGGGG